MKAAIALFVTLAAAPALAQSLPPGASPGLPGPESVNPALNASGPYLGPPGKFYAPADRPERPRRAAGEPSPHEAAGARADLRRIHAFADAQRSRHGGELRDWDRERMTRMMDDLVRRYPDLKGLGAPCCAGDPKVSSA